MFRYVNHLGETIELGNDRFMINEREFRKYLWSYNSRNNKITSFFRDISENQIQLLVHGDNCRSDANRMHEIFDKDVRDRVPGRIEINGFYLKGFMIGSSVPEKVYPRTIAFSLNWVSDSEYWTREIDRRFFKSAEEDMSDADGLDYPYDYPYDYGSKNNVINTFNNPSAFESDFVMTIYGPCENPYVVINGHRYGINGSLFDGETLVINSADKTIIKTGYAIQENWFAKRYKPDSIFEKIPGGISSMTWDGTFGFNITILDQRSEPPWEIISETITPEPEEPEEPEDITPDEEDEGYILSDGSVYVLSDGRVYEVAG